MQTSETVYWATEAVFFLTSEQQQKKTEDDSGYVAFVIGGVTFSSIGKSN